MSAAAPWSVKGIEPKAREIAKDLARRSGMTLGEWLNTMILEDDDEGVVPLSRRAHAADSFERRGRTRRMDDAYGGREEPWERLAASVDAIAGRLEAAERRSTIAIQGVDQAVAGLVHRLDNQDQVGKTHGRRVDDIAEELREGHKRLRRFETEIGPRTTETFGKFETTLGALAGRLYDIEERQRSSVNELRQRMDGVEKAAGPGPGADLLSQVGQRLDQAQNRTTEALRGLERSFAGLDQRLRAAEARVEPEGAREAARFEKLAETLSRQVENNRVEMMRRLDTAETEGRMDRLERAVLAIGDQVKSSEERSAKAVEAMGREVLRIAQNLNGRVENIETEGPAKLEQLSRGIEQRLVAADDRHALALEKLGGEITRISDRLSERIAESERRSAQALDEIGRRLADSSSRIEQGYDRASGELAERMRLSEERTAALIAEARNNMGRRADPAPAKDPARDAEPDWRAAAFPDTGFPDADFGGDDGFEDPVFAEQQAWSADLAPPVAEPGEMSDEALSADAIFDAVLRGPRMDGPPAAPFGSRSDTAAQSASPAASPATPEVPTFAAPPVVDAAPAAVSDPAPFGQGFGGADVSDALEATAPETFDAGAGDFAGETDFVDPRALRAAAAQGRASSTRQAIDAARAAMTAPEAETPARSGFGLKRGGKSKLQERLDKQGKDGSTIRKALGASSVAVLLTAGGALAFGELTGSGVTLASLVGGAPAEATPIAAMAVVPAAASPADKARAATLYQQAIEQLDTGDQAGVETLKQAAALGLPSAQLHLAGLYQDGGSGVVVNPREARVWARRAADAGDPRGMHAYGMYLFDGVGGAQDRGEALGWLRKAADRGLVDSQFNVAKLYETGDVGIAADPVEAYKWYLIAARAGDGDAQAAVDRLKAAIPAPERGAAQAAAAGFAAEPLA